jgi:hypothetical protein
MILESFATGCSYNVSRIRVTNWIRSVRMYSTNNLGTDQYNWIGHRWYLMICTSSRSRHERVRVLYLFTVQPTKRYHYRRMYKFLTSFQYETRGKVECSCFNWLKEDDRKINHAMFCQNHSFKLNMSRYDRMNTVSRQWILVINQLLLKDMLHALLFIMKQ